MIFINYYKVKKIMRNEIKRALFFLLPFLEKKIKFRKILNAQKPFLNRSNADVFSEIYQRNLWGGGVNDKVDYFSGPGSYGVVAEEYVTFVNNFIADNRIQSLTDLGCGDFNVGSQIAAKNWNLKYSACDVVSSLIEHNTVAFKHFKNVEFKVIDGSNDDLPLSQLLTVRQVLQHLSNNDIHSIIKASKAFKYVIITEHILKPGKEKSFNKDKPSGPSIRLSELSGVYLEKDPYNLKLKEVLRVRADFKGIEAYLVSYLMIN
jgi:hypothetical protein